MQLPARFAIARGSDSKTGQALIVPAKLTNTTKLRSDGLNF